MAAQIPKKFQQLTFRVGTVFTPSAPIDQQSLFAGRIQQLQKTIDAIGSKGQHVVLYGERGVGKTSLASTVAQIYAELLQPTRVLTVRQNCHSTDTYGKVWSRSFADVKFAVERPRIGFTNELVKEMRSLAASVSESPAPDEIVSTLRRIDAKIVFVFDEFDQVADRAVSIAFAETIKALSDYAVPSTIVLVGVGDSVDGLIASHASIERAIVQVHLPRMDPGELSEIVDKAMSALGTSCEDEARNRIVRLSQGLPHYVHLLGLHSARQAFQESSTEITLEHVNAGIALALSNASQSVLDAYLKAVSSPQRTRLFRDVLLACALAPTDDLGFFTPASIRAPLKVMGQELDIPAFASHLNKFSSEGRGEILQKVGFERRYRYRFRNPLLQPFVVMQGIADGRISIHDVDRLLSVRAAAR